MLPPTRKLQYVAGTGSVFGCHHKSSSPVPDPEEQRTAAVSEHGYKSGHSAWLQEQLPFLWPIVALSQKGSLLTVRADGQETAERWKLPPSRGAAVTQTVSMQPRQTSSRGNSL